MLEDVSSLYHINRPFDLRDIVFWTPSYYTFPRSIIIVLCFITHVANEVCAVHNECILGGQAHSRHIREPFIA